MDDKRHLPNYLDSEIRIVKHHDSERRGSTRRDCVIRAICNVTGRDDAARKALYRHIMSYANGLGWQVSCRNTRALDPVIKANYEQLLADINKVLFKKHDKARRNDLLCVANRGDFNFLSRCGFNFTFLGDNGQLEDCPETCILFMRRHAVASVDGVMIDSWDSRKNKRAKRQLPPVFGYWTLGAAVQGRGIHGIVEQVHEELASKPARKPAPTPQTARATRKPRITPEQLKMAVAWRHQGKSFKFIADNLGCSGPGIRNALIRIAK